MAALKRIWVCKLRTVSNLDPIYHLTAIPIFTGRNEVVAKEIFLHLSVILFTGGGCLPQCMLGYPPEQTPPRSRQPPGSRHPLGADPPGPDTISRVDTPQSRHPQEQTPPWEQTPPSGVDTPHSRHPPGSRHPPWKADSGIRSMNGRYASYWNVFLFYYLFPFLH